MNRRFLILIPIILLISVIFKSFDFPGGMFFPGWFFGIILIIVILTITAILSSVLTYIFSKINFLLFFSVLTSISFIIFHIYFYSPTLKIIVPNNYVGEVDLVLSNTKENILNIDKNGIGYITQWTFDNTYTKPKVYNENGNNLENRLKGFNNLIFWSNGGDCCVNGKDVKSLQFEVLPYNKTENKFVFRQISKLVDENKVKTFKGEVATIKIDSTEVK